MCLGRQCTYGTSTSWTTLPLTPDLSMYMLDIDASTDMTYVFTCELCTPKTTTISTSKKSPDESPQNAFKSPPKMSKVFVKFNAGVPASAARERLFSVGKDGFSAKRNRLSDKNFEKPPMCRVNERFCPGI